MVTTSSLRAKSSEILEEANKIGIQQVFISEQEGCEESDEDEYIPPFSFIIRAKKPDDVDKEALLSFEGYLKSELLNVGIKIHFEYLLKDNIKNGGFLAKSSKHFLDTAIDITQIDTGKSWKVQFEEQQKRNANSHPTSSPKEEALDLEEPKAKKPRPSDSPLRRQEQLKELTDFFNDISETEVNSLSSETMSKMLSRIRKIIAQPQRSLTPTGNEQHSSKKTQLSSIE
jgi:hypothetical protein